MSADKKTAEPEAPAKGAPAPKPAKPIDQTHHGRVRKPHGGATHQPKE